MIRNRVAFKLGCAIVAVFIFVLTFLGLAVERMFSSFYSTEMRTEVKELTSHIASMNEPANVTAEETLMKLADFSDTRILYIDRQGRVLAHSGEKDIADLSFIREKDVQALFSGKRVGVEYTDVSGERFFAAAEPIPDPGSGQIKSAVYVLSSTRHMDESISAIRRLLVLSATGALLLALGISYCCPIAIKTIAADAGGDAQNCLGRVRNAIKHRQQ
ncbi:hypothetical protein [Paenibacillus sp. BAC0078]